MTSEYQYRPRFTDIRVRKPMKLSVARVEPKTCEAEGCTSEAKCKAPKSRDNPLDKWDFCEKHAAEYNKNWDFFAGMTDGEQRAFAAAERHGHRPTWSFGAKGGSRESATIKNNNRFGGNAPGETYYSRKGRARRAAALETASQAAAPIRRAYEDLGLPVSATAAEVRSTYAELVRRYHPDSNGGDRSAETRLGLVVKAYKVLKSSKRA